MRRHSQSLNEIVDRLRPLEVDWQDDSAVRVIERLRKFPVKERYDRDDILELVGHPNFEDTQLVLRTFLGLSKDQYSVRLSDELGPGGIGVKRLQSDPDSYVSALLNLGILDSILIATSKVPHWSDVLIERLRSGRGSAISGQRRGRGLERNVEEVVARVFGSSYVTNCNFIGLKGFTAKCDIAIPNPSDPDIVIETKGYGATGSKMTDILGDIRKIFEVKRPDTYFLIFTDGITWRARKSDLAKLVEFQNDGKIYRIYTLADIAEFESDLEKIKVERAIS